MTALQGSIQLWTQNKADWTFENPTLLAGQKGIEADTMRSKTGDGVTAWNDLRYDQAPRVQVLTTTTSIALDVDTYDEVDITALASALTLAAPTGTPYNGQIIAYHIKDNGTARPLAYNAAFVDLTGSAPTTTTISKKTIIAARWSASRSKWEVFASVTEA